MIRVGLGHVFSGMINRNSGRRCDVITPPRASTMKLTRKPACESSDSEVDFEGEISSKVFNFCLKSSF